MLSTTSDAICRGRSCLAPRRRGSVLVGYYALTMGGVRREALPARYGRGLPTYEIGMVPLARFAIADDHQGQGLGRDLLIEAIERAADAGTQVAARFIAVDPIDENARAFYEEFAFNQIQGDAGGRMYLRIDEPARLLSRTPSEASGCHSGPSEASGALPVSQHPQNTIHQNFEKPHLP